jgi:ketosteroid isomerase-like protein
MRKIFLTLVSIFVASSLYADNHDSTAEAVRKSSEAFNIAYETNDVEGYFGLYEKDAMIYFYGDRWTVSDYYDYWKNNMVGAGGGVEKNATSNMQIKVSPDGNTAIVSVYVDNRSRSPEGEINEEKGYETEIWSKIDGEWKIIALHYSLIP